MNCAWQVTPQKVQAAVQRIVEISRPRKVILFGSYVRDDMHRHSDLDVLVVTKEPVENPRGLTAR